MTEGLRRRETQRSTAAMRGLLQQAGQPGAVIGHVQRKTEKLISARDVLLCHVVMRERESGASAPECGEFAFDEYGAGLRGLVVRDELLFDGTQIELERLVGREKFRLLQLRRQIVTERADRGAANAVDARGQIELLGAAEEVPVGPCAARTGAEIGRMGRVEGDGLRRPFVDLELERK